MKKHIKEEDMKSILSAMSQMVSNKRLGQEELNQLSERGFPVNSITEAVKELYELEDVAAVKDLQDKGKVDSVKTLTYMFNKIFNK